MSDNYEQPVEPMSRTEDILRGNTSTVPMSRIEDLLKQLIAGGGGGGSTVTITTDYQTGTKIATLTIDGTDYNVYIPTDQIGSIVSISTDYQTGTKIATLTIDDTPYNIYIPSVTVTPEYDSGTKIATINGTDIFAPSDAVGAKVYSGIGTPASNVGVNGDIYAKFSGESTYEDILLSNVVVDENNTYMPFVIDVTDASALVIETMWGTFTKNIEDIPPYEDTAETKQNIYIMSAYYSCGVSRDGNTFYFYVKTPSGVSGGPYIQTVKKRVTTYLPTNVDALYFKLHNNWVIYNPPSE